MARAQVTPSIVVANEDRVMKGSAPSFKGFQPSSEASSRTKRANKRRDTTHEVLLRRQLWSMGMRFRKNVDALPGKPDLVFLRARVVVFCDGDFWHGRNWPTLKAKLVGGANSDYWLAKIEANVERDKRNTALLEDGGWRVIRLWETDIKRDRLRAALQVKEAVEEVNRHGNA